MVMGSSLRKLVIGFVVCFVAIVGRLGGGGQDNKTPPEGSGKGQPKELKPFYFGVKSCDGCHVTPPAYEKKPLVCECDEYTTWTTHDKHKDAYNVLKGPRGKRMGELLKKNVTQPEAGCLYCHGIVTSKEYEHETFAISDGVSCVVCHGAHREWVSEHKDDLKRKEWRDLNRKQKKDRFGMKDLWDPVVRTQVCVSCHVGNAVEGWFVTHEMYAAGHPPLPGIELATFSQQMPKHWRYIDEKPEPVQKLLKFAPKSQKFERTKLVVVSSVITLTETLRLLAAQAKQCGNAKEGNDQALDFAYFDCYACHHDLKTPSWRQERGYRGKPGRPQMRPWPTALARICLLEIPEHEEMRKKLEEGLQQLYGAFGERPLGNCPKIAAIAEGLAKSLADTGKKLAEEATPRYEARAPGLVRRLLAIKDIPDKEIPDYDSARQIAWAIEIILQEWDVKKAKDAQVQQVLATLKKDLKLGLPKERSIEGELGDSLKRINDYNPDEFRQALKKLAALLPSR